MLIKKQHCNPSMLNKTNYKNMIKSIITLEEIIISEIVLNISKILINSEKFECIYSYREQNQNKVILTLFYLFIKSTNQKKNLSPKPRNIYKTMNHDRLTGH